MKTKFVSRLAIALNVLAVAAMPSTGTELLPKSIDVALKNGGVLVGQVVTPEGQAVTGAEVVLFSGGKEIARCKTVDEGWFHVAGLKGGSLEVAAAGSRGHCRVWVPGTAPPAAQRGVLVVADSDVIRAQHCGSPVGCGSAVGGRGVPRHGGGLLGLMIEHPLVTAGAVGAAIAIPLAVSNSDAPSSP